MKLTIGYEEYLGVGTPTVIEQSDGTPVAIGGTNLVLTVQGGQVLIRSSEGRIVARVRSSNEIAVGEEPFSVLEQVSAPALSEEV